MHQINETGRCIWGAVETPRVPTWPRALSDSAPAGKKNSIGAGMPIAHWGGGVGCGALCSGVPTQIDHL